MQADKSNVIPGPDPGACPNCGAWMKAGLRHVCSRPTTAAEVVANTLRPPTTGDGV